VCDLQAVRIAQLSTLSSDNLKIVLPTEESFPRWINFNDFEKVIFHIVPFRLISLNPDVTGSIPLYEEVSKGSLSVMYAFGMYVG